MRRPIFISLLLAGITLAVFWPAGTFDAVCLDDSFFTDAPEVRSGLNGDSLKWALTETVAANWHPVTSLSFVLTRQFFGNNPGAEHLLNVFLHAANVVLLFLMLRWMTGRGSADTTWRCAAVAALFAWHPLRVESVAWIAERKDVLCAFFFLLTVWLYAVYADKSAETPAGRNRRRTIFYGFSLLAFALALLSKAMAVTLPCVLLLLDVWPLQRLQVSSFKFQVLRKLVMEKIPFFALTIVFCVVTFWVQRNDSATPSLAELNGGLRLENMIVSYWRYLGWSLWPDKLAAYYPFPYDHHFYLGLWPAGIIAVAAVMLVVISALCIRQIKPQPYLAVGWFWYLGMMVPVIGLVQVGGQGMADRYTYLPLIGPVMGCVWFLAERFKTKPRFKIGGMILLLLILGAGIGQTRRQLMFWKNSDTLFRHTIEVTGDNPRAEYLLGLSLEHDGNMDEAIVHYRNAVAARPKVKDAFSALGRLLAQQGKWKEAQSAYAALLADRPDDFVAHLGLATTLVHLNRTSEATGHLKTAMERCPDTADALNNLAWTLATSEAVEFRDGANAVTCAERACQLTHYKETVMLGTLGAAYAEAGRFEEAIMAGRKACELAAKNSQQPLLEINQQLIERYRRHQPYRETSPTTPD